MSSSPRPTNPTLQTPALNDVQQQQQYNLHTPVEFSPTQQANNYYSPRNPASPAASTPYQPTMSVFPPPPQQHRPTEEPVSRTSSPGLPGNNTYQLTPQPPFDHTLARSPPPPFDPIATPPPAFTHQPPHLQTFPLPPTDTTSQTPPPQTPKTPYTPAASAGPNGGIHAPGQIAHPNQRPTTNRYSHSLCSCFGSTLCCTAYWCPCIMYSRTHHRLKTVPNSNLNEHKSCNGLCLAFCVCLPVSWVATLAQRLRIRENYRIEGGVVGDCCKSCWCQGCVLVQDEREVEEREDERRRFAGPGSGVVGDGGYRRASGMVYA